MQGWIKLHRKVKGHWLFTEKRTFTKFEAWIDLLLEVNHKDNKFMLGNELVEVKRGQTITSIRQLCDRWNWSNSKVSKFLKMLESDEMLSLKSDTKKTVITIDNYDIYQVQETEETTRERHESDTRATQKHTNKNDKNVKNDKSSRQKFKYEPSDMELAELLFNYIQDNGEGTSKPTNMDKWANEIRLLRERDKKSTEQIRNSIVWCQNHSFWKTVILSPAKLREKYTQLSIRAKEEQNKTKMRKRPNTEIDWEEL